MHCWRRIACFALMAGLLASLAGCTSTTDGKPTNVPSGRRTLSVNPADPIRCVATTGMVADVVRNVGGPLVAVDQLMGAGVDPHLYKASTGDIARLGSAEAIFFSGLHLEGKMADVFVGLARRRPTYAVTERIADDRLLEVAAGHYDPHVWFDVSLWSETVPVVRNALVEIDPAHREDYRQRAEAYRAQLDELHQWCKAQAATIPPEHRVLVTAHDAFHYFGRAYGLEVRAIQGISTESEAGVREINELVAFLVERKIKAVFVESSVSERNIRALVEGCHAQEHEVAVGGELFSDAMGAAGTPEGTYIGMVRHNVNTIVGALR